MIAESLYTKLTENKGWGVFTDKLLHTDMIIEISPVIIMSSAEKKLLDQTALYNYIFDWEGDQCCMAMGLIPVYNHAAPSNCEYFQDYKNGEIFVKTMRDIHAGEELTINYNGDWDNQKKVWFEPFE